MLQDVYPVFVLEVDKAETTFADVDAIIDFIRERCEAHPKATWIATFDHLAHTRRIGGEIGEDIREAKEAIFCFGVRLPDPAVLAVRPRAIGVADKGGKFVLTWMEAPMPIANEAMREWTLAVKNA
ncbi:MAG TPA: hypothetical protein ENK13_00170 [Thermopetrobacter sp.]|nr:hypothetical protein [Thermopetrobacter sp.]